MGPPTSRGRRQQEGGRVRQGRRRGENSRDEVPDEYRWEATLSHMSRVATEAGPARPSSGSPAMSGPSNDTGPLVRGLRRQQLHRTRKPVAGCYHRRRRGTRRLGHTSTTRSIRSTATGAGGARAVSGSPATTSSRDTGVWAPQARRMWKDIGKACE